MNLARAKKISRVTSLPDQIHLLRSEAAAEGVSNMEALFSQWHDGSNRFGRPGELLAIASIDGDVAGIGGITEDFIDPAALRMRRFYVRANYRRNGVGRALAHFVLETATPLDRQIVVHAATEEAGAFWEAMGFERIEREKTTHALLDR
jgi:GNAT superfamily N-acetyltransferase